MNPHITFGLSFLLTTGIWNQETTAATPDGLGRADRVPTIVLPQLAMATEPGSDPQKAPWAKAVRVGGFMHVDGQARDARPTWVEIAYDARALWVRFRCEGQRGYELKADETERDGFVWRDDSVELLISPPDAETPLYHFIVNAAGVVFDGVGLDKSWDAAWTTQVDTDADGWSAIMIIPFKALAPLPPPRAGDSWRMNLCRNYHKGEKKERGIWSPTLGALQLSRYYGRVEFGGRNAPCARFMQVDPVVIGDNFLRVQSSSPARYDLAAIDGTGRSVRMGRGLLSADGAIPFRIDDDEIHGVALSLSNDDGEQIAHVAYPMESPAITAKVMQLDEQIKSVNALLDQLPEAARDRARAIVSDVRPRLKDAVSTVSDPERHTAENWRRLAPIVSEIELDLDGPAGFAKTLGHSPGADFAVGLANSMQKIMIQGHAFEGWHDDHYDLALARNEHEAFQVVVMPFHEDLEEVSVSVSSLVSSGGDALKGATEVSPVGHVDVDDNTRYKVAHHGWWPDPLLSFQKRCDIRAGDHVAFWIDVATHADAKPGDYRGTVTVTAKGCDPIELALNVHVWDFRLIDGTHLRNAFTYNEGPVGHFYPDRWDASMRRKYHDLILDHRLNVDHLYRRTPPDIELLDYASTRGLNAFNVGGDFRNERKGQEQRELYRYIAELKKKDLFRYAYVYGFDEVKPEKFAEMREVFGKVHQRYPGLETMTTAIDHSYGRDTGLRDVVDIWVPLTDWYDLDEAAQLRAEGKHVWWYICVVPEHPYANWFIEYPAIEARLLTGAMSYKYQVDGFLYYMINLWTGNHHPISGGPYTEWDPGSLVNEEKDYTANGDGSLICPGPDGPLSTIRLENIRDGLEDYEYLYMLAERTVSIHGLPESQERKAYLTYVETLLAVPSSVVRNLVEYSRDPDALYTYREQLAEAILEGDRLAQSAN